MPARKKVSSKKAPSRKKAAASSRKAKGRSKSAPARAKASKKKAASKKKVVGKKKPAAMKKATAKKKPAAKKKTVTKKKPAAKKKAAAKKPATRKKVTVKKKAAGKKAATKKKVTVKKKAAAKKKVATKKKPPARKTSAKKKAPSRKKTAARKPSPRRKTTARREKRFGAHGPLHGFAPYRPKRGESYMGENMLEHFRQILLAWKRELMEEVDRTVGHMKDEAANFPDPADRATQEEEFSIELRTRDRERKLIKKIDQTIDRLDGGDFGYCDTCGVEIGLRRLEARPTATQCVDCKSLAEIKEKQLHG